MRDRLRALLPAVVLLAACSGGSEPPAPVPTTPAAPAPPPRTATPTETAVRGWMVASFDRAVGDVVSGTTTLRYPDGQAAFDAVRARPITMHAATLTYAQFPMSVVPGVIAPPLNTMTVTGIAFPAGIGVDVAEIALGSTAGSETPHAPLPSPIDPALAGWDTAVRAFAQTRSIPWLTSAPEGALQYETAGMLNRAERSAAHPGRASDFFAHGASALSDHVSITGSNEVGYIRVAFIYGATTSVSVSAGLHPS